MAPKDNRTHSLADILADYDHGGSFEDDASLIVVRHGSQPMSKEFSRDENGKITKAPGGGAKSGGYSAMVVAVPNVDAMADLLRIVGEDPNAGICVGRIAGAPGSGSKSERFRLVSAKRASELGGEAYGWHESNDDVGGMFIARNKSNLSPSSWLLFDRDFTDCQADELRFEDVGEWREKMIEAFPPLARANWVDLPSSSTRLVGLDGKPLMSSPSSHHYVMLKNANDYSRLGAALLTNAMLGGIGFRRVWGEHARSWSIFDPTTISWERFSFEGKPVTLIEDTDIAPPAISVHRVEGDGLFDSELVKLPDNKQRQRLSEEQGLTIEVKIRTQHDGSVIKTASTVDDTELALTTEIDTQDQGVMTMADLWLHLAAQPGDFKMRCQAPFRPSSSWAALIRLDKAGVPFVYDVGPHVMFRLRDEDRLGPLPDVFYERLATAGLDDDEETIVACLTAWVQAMVRHGYDRERVDAEIEEISGDLKTELWPKMTKKAFDKKLKAIWKPALAKATKAEAEHQTMRTHRGGMHISEALEVKNDQYGVAMYGGKIAVITEQFDRVLGHWKPHMLPPHDLGTFHKNEYARLDGKLVSVWPMWMGWSGRNTFDSVIFEPEATFRDAARDARLQQGGIYNTWMGFALEPTSENSATPAAIAGADLFENYLRVVICDESDEKFEWFMDWIAAKIQNPARIGMPVPILRGSQGTGKTTFYEIFLNPLFGIHSAMLTKPEHLVGRFNAHFGVNVIALVAEAMWGGNKQQEGDWKALVTDETRPIEPKFRDVFMARNYTSPIVMTNDDWPVPVGLQDRRHAFFDVSDAHKQDRDYFGALRQAVVNDGGRRVFLHRMVNRKIDEKRLNAVPTWQSEAADDAQQRSMDSFDRWLVAWAKTGSVSGQGTNPYQANEQFEWSDTGGAIVPTQGEPLFEYDTTFDHHLHTFELALADDAPQTFGKAEVFAAYCAYVHKHGREKPLDAVWFWRNINTLEVGGAKAFTSIARRMLPSKKREKQRVEAPSLADLRLAVEGRTGRKIIWDRDE